LIPGYALLGYAAFWHWETAVIYLIPLVLFTIFAVRRYEKHQRPYAYDDRLTSARIDEAIARYIAEEVKRRNVETDSR